MALATYSDLKQAIQDWKARSDLATKADDFIDLAEAFFNVKLRQLQMEKQDTITTTADNAIVSLPSDYLGMINLSLSDDPAPLEMVSLKYIDDRFEVAQVGRPRYFALPYDEGVAKIKLAPTPDSVYTLNINYFYGIESLSDSNTTNWLMTKYPNLYLSTCLYEASKYIKDFEEANIFAAEIATLLSVFESAGRRDRTPQQRFSQKVVYNVV